MLKYRVLKRLFDVIFCLHSVVLLTLNLTIFLRPEHSIQPRFFNMEMITLDAYGGDAMHIS